MRFLKTLFWVLVVVAIALFSVRNWTPVTINLWGGLVMDTKLPALLIAAFLLGLVPYFLIHRATRWSMRRKLETAERSVADLRTARVPAPAPPASAIPSILPPVAAPIAVPPGVS